MAVTKLTSKQQIQRRPKFLKMKSTYIPLLILKQATLVTQTNLISKVEIRRTMLVILHKMRHKSLLAKKREITMINLVKYRQDMQQKRKPVVVADEEIVLPQETAK